MLTLDISKTIPQKALSHLTLLIPGCFFEVSILLAHPQLVASHVRDLDQVMHINPYLLLGLALFVAFIIGSAAEAFGALLLLILKGLHAIRTSPTVVAVTAVLKSVPATLRLLIFKIPTPPRLFLPRTLTRYEDSDQAARVWRRLAAKLLCDRYGIRPRHLKRDWLLYMVALADISHEEARGSVFVSMLQATGWCGLFATLFAPALRTTYYLGPCAIFIFVGLLASYNVVLNMKDTFHITLLSVRALIREYEKDRRMGAESARRPHDPNSPDE